MPTGTPTRLPSKRINDDPAIALAIPPPTSPGGLGVWVRNARLMEPNPLYTRYPKTAAKGSRTRITAVMAAIVARWSMPCRHRLILGAITVCVFVWLAMRPRGGATRDCPHQNLRQDIHDDGHNKQRQTNLDERA